VQHTARYLTDKLERVINDNQTKTSALVTAVLTDNAINMVSAWRLLETKLLVFGGGGALLTSSTW